MRRPNRQKPEPRREPRVGPTAGDLGRRDPDGISTGTLPSATSLVALVSGMPIMRAAIAATLRPVADVREFGSGAGDLDDLLGGLEPDVIIVDDDADARTAERYATEARVPLVHLALDSQELRVFIDGSWGERGPLTSPELVRNVVVDTCLRARTPRRRLVAVPGGAQSDETQGE